jgi:hypothetical protein
MSLYDAAKDALKVAQKADNIELIEKLLDVQKQALDMQEKQQEQNAKISQLQAENESLKKRKQYKYDEGHTWMIDPANPTVKLCPVCINRDGFENPTVDVYGNQYCATCGKKFK